MYYKYAADFIGFSKTGVEITEAIIEFKEFNNCKIPKV